MADGFPLSRQKHQPEQPTQPPTANKALLPPGSARLQPYPRVNTDRWYYRVFQSAPDLIRSLLPGSAATPTVLGLDPADPGDRLYRFAALEIKELSHRLDGVLWPSGAAGGADAPGSRLPPPPGGADLSVSSEAPAVGAFGGGGDHTLQEVHWISLEALSQQPNLDPLLNLLTLPVRP